MRDRARVRLWTRLAESADGSSQIRNSEDVGLVVESIREHLAWLLNSRHGESLACPRFGLPDLTGVVAGLPYKNRRRFQELLESSIRQHEQRVSSVRVEMMESENSGLINSHFLAIVGLAIEGETEFVHVRGSVDKNSAITFER